MAVREEVAFSLTRARALVDSIRIILERDGVLGGNGLLGVDSSCEMVGCGVGSPL